MPPSTMSSAAAASPLPTYASVGTLVEQSLFVSVSVVQQAIDFLDLLTDDSQMAYPSKSLPGGTIGKHIRHSVEHFNLLLKVYPQSSYYVRDLIVYNSLIPIFTL